MKTKRISKTFILAYIIILVCLGGATFASAQNSKALINDTGGEYILIDPRLAINLESSYKKPMIITLVEKTGKEEPVERAKIIASIDPLPDRLSRGLPYTLKKQGQLDQGTRALLQANTVELSPDKTAQSSKIVKISENPICLSMLKDNIISINEKGMGTSMLERGPPLVMGGF